MKGLIDSTGDFNVIKDGANQPGQVTAMTSDENDDVALQDLLRMTTSISASYLANNQVPASQVQTIISSIRSALGALMQTDQSENISPPEPAVPIRRSITPDYLICLEDGKKLKMLKRYLRAKYDMTPEDYRAKWGLPPDYPMVAPNYAKQRSEFARQIGLGRK